MFNKFMCVGNLVKDPETKKVKDAEFTTFTVAVNGYKKEDVSYFSCITFGKLGESIAKNCVKGSKVLIDGTLHTRTYESEKRGKQFVTEVIVNSCEFLSFNGNKTEKPEPELDFPPF